MPTSIEDLFRLHAHIFHTAGDSGKPSASTDPSTASAKPQTKQEILQKLVAAFLEKNSPDNLLADSLQKLLSQVRDLKIVDLSARTKVELQKLGLPEISEKTPSDIAGQILETVKNGNAPSQRSEVLKSVRDTLLESTIKSIRKTIDEIAKVTGTVQGPVAETVKTSPVKLLTELVRNIVPKDIQINETSVRLMLANHVEQLTDASSEMKLELLKGTSHPLEPLTLILQSALKVLEKAVPSENVESLKKLLETLLKDIQELIRLNAPEEELRSFLESAQKSLETFSEKDVTEKPLNKIVSVVRGQIEILLSSDELIADDGIHFEKAGETFQQFAKELSKSLMKLLDELPAGSPSFDPAKKAEANLKKLFDGMLTKEEVVVFRKSLTELQNTLPSIHLETPIKEEIAHSIRTLSGITPEKVTEIIERVVQSRGLPEDRVITLLAKTAVQELLKEPLLQNFTGPVQSPIPYSIVESLIKNVDETRALLQILAGGKDAQQARKLLDILTQAKDGSLSTKEIKNALEEALLRLPQAALHESAIQDPQQTKQTAIAGAKPHQNSLEQVARQVMQTPTTSQLTKSELSLLRSAEQMMQTDQLLRQINPMMESAGQPIFILFPAFIRGFLSSIQISFFNLPAEKKEEHSKQSQSTQSHYTCAAFSITLPKLGELACYIALRGDEMHIAIGSKHSQVVSYLKPKLSQLTTALKACGYTKISCTTQCTENLDITPGWLKILADDSRAVA